MPSLKEDMALAVNLLRSDTQLCSLMGLTTQSLKANQIVPLRRQPNEASDIPLISLYFKHNENLGGSVTSNSLITDVYLPLTTQAKTGISLDITRRIKQVLDRKPIGRRLEWLNTDPDRLSTTGWHKATVTFTFRSTQY